MSELHENYGRVLGFFRSRGFPDDEARDLTQETFCRAIRRIHTLRVPAALGDWILRIAANVGKNEIRHRRASKRDATKVSLGAPDPGGEVAVLATLEAQDVPDPLDELLAAERLAAVLLCLDELQPRTRRCLMLFFFQNRTYQEIADLLQIPIGRVRSHIHRGRRSIKRCFERRLGQGGP